MHFHRPKPCQFIIELIQKIKERWRRKKEKERLKMEASLKEIKGYIQDRKDWQQMEVEMTVRYIEAFTKMCPRCRHRIELEDDYPCFTIRCTCGQQFCFICNAPWEANGPRKHHELCAFHPEFYLRGSLTV
ncbi:hypothetical protein DL98DRAFT_521098 [Cadophora sp. DSE1049]|nr:hypothetical protein DL98DRAFT_521098 [Cadophora sp. DSE1049]